MSQQYPPQAAPPKKKRKGCLYGVIGAAVFVVIIVAASSGGDGDSSTGSKTSAKPAASSASAPAQKSPVTQFQAFVNAQGTPTEKAAVKHVTKVQGADSDNGIADTPEVYTDYTGDLTSGDANKGKLIASAFADWQHSRGKESKNGLVTIYNQSGEILSNGQY